MTIFDVHGSSLRFVVASQARRVIRQLVPLPIDVPGQRQNLGELEGPNIVS